MVLNSDQTSSLQKKSGSESCFIQGFCRRIFALLFLAVFLSASSATHAQLAVTEVMSWALNKLGSAIVTDQADWWELHNFGTNTIDLSNHLFCDSDKDFPSAAASNFFFNLEIGPGETILFVREFKNTDDSNHFCRIWGETKIPSATKIVFYPSEYGFDQTEDSVVLGDPQGCILDRADFFSARRGRTFTYDTKTGLFGVTTQPGDRFVWKATTADDYGSPGFVPTGPIPLSIPEQPASQVIDAGSPECVFSVKAHGLPHPSYQWRHNGVNIPGAKSSTLILTDITTDDGGTYDVIVDNGSAHGLERLASSAATLTVNTIPTAPTARMATGDSYAYSNQTVVLAAIISGYPTPTLRWFFASATNSEIKRVENAGWTSGANTRRLMIERIGVESSGVYQVEASNSLGQARATVRIEVGPKPNLMITEIMNQNCTNGAQLDTRNWWELTNMDLRPYNLKHWLWDDFPGNFGGGFVIPYDLIIRPGESIIFAESMTRAEFVKWWGASNLPPNLQVVTYTANGLSASGEEIHFWNSAAVNRNDVTDQLASVNFSGAIPGSSFWFIPELLCAQYGIPSELGQYGAFKAAENCDIGSPGYYWLTTRIQISRGAGGRGVKLSWKTNPGFGYQLQYRNTYYDMDWHSLGDYTASGSTLSVNDNSAGVNGQRYYRVLIRPVISCE